ncbi:hypothetical protein U9M48_036789, partial [Paspalum notatum var. saurae]
SKEECEHLISLAKPHMKRSRVVDPRIAAGKESSSRTSSGMFLSRGQDEIIRAIEKRIADITKVPVGMYSPCYSVWCSNNGHFIRSMHSQRISILTISFFDSSHFENEHGEGLQVIYYEIGQKFEPHFDYTENSDITKRGGPRMATLVMYLSDVEEGGETVFPEATAADSGSSSIYNRLLNSFKKGISVKPKMGNALLFWSMKPDGSIDPKSKHGSCPVIKGDKWASTKWLHKAKRASTTPAASHPRGLAPPVPPPNPASGIPARALDLDRTPSTAPPGSTASPLNLAAFSGSHAPPLRDGRPPPPLDDACARDPASATERRDCGMPLLDPSAAGASPACRLCPTRVPHSPAARRRQPRLPPPRARPPPPCLRPRSPAAIACAAVDLFAAVTRVLPSPELPPSPLRSNSAPPLPSRPLPVPRREAPAGSNFMWTLILAYAS